MKRNMLLLVDDMIVNREILGALFEREYNILEAENGEQALLLLNQYQDSISAMLLDIIMPVKDGYEVLASMGQSGLISKIPVVIITSENSIESEVRAFDMGASDIIMKPFEPHVVCRRLQNAVELNQHRQHLEELVEKQAIKLQKSKDVLTGVLSSVIESRSIESGWHIQRIRMFTRVLLENIMHSYPEYHLNEHTIDIISSASALHDIGKISIPDAILNKPGTLTEDEFNIIKTHSEKGCEILARLDQMDDKEYLRYAYNICRYHHERWDGKGYPEGLKGESIPICAQVVGIADAYDALTTDRVYHKACSSEKAYNMILNGECGSFSPKIMECFKSVRNQFVELSQSYDDGESPEENLEKPAISRQVQQIEEQNTQQYGEMKYAAMMRYANATLMEVNLDNGIYYLVYAINEDFETLRNGNNYAVAAHNFITRLVHPDDRESAHQAIDSYEQDFVENGMLKRVGKYRILHGDMGEYIWYEATVLRINIYDPRPHNILVAWRVLPQGVRKQSLQAGNFGEIPVMQNLQIGIQQCINDRYYTITNVNQGFIHLFGYSREEIKEVFHNRYVEMIYSEDRMEVDAQIKEQSLKGNTIELKYRVASKDGRIIWVLEKCQLYTAEDGIEYLGCVMTDISQVKQAEEELRLTMERHQIIMDQTNDIIFEWDMAKDTLSYSANWAKTFGYEPISEEISEQIPRASHILPEDVSRFVLLMKEVKKGIPYAETEIRIVNENGEYIWCRIRATVQFDQNGVAIKAVGVILDINNEKIRTQELIDKSERDTLTGLYNKGTARSKIQKHLKKRKKEDQYAMLIIDLDNFKQINDTRGHMFGDVVLKEIALQLKKLFRSEDIVARIGGDEFLVFAHCGNDTGVIEQRAGRVVESFHYILNEELGEYRLSCSIGISGCPADGTAYQELFQSSDQALYFAKKQGKDQYAIYDKADMLKSFDVNSEQSFVPRTQIESDDNHDLDTYNIIQQVFKALCEAGEMNLAINTILELIGRKNNVSRVYVFEDSLDGTCSNTFEWCNEGIKPEIESRQDISYSEDLGGIYQENFDENGIFYCPDITELPEMQYHILLAQGIQSVLQCAVREAGRYVGFVGFDDCMGRRIWRQGEIDILSFLTELLSPFLLKRRAQNESSSES